MAMSKDEFNANLRVQGLKTLVDEASAAINSGTLSQLTSKKLGELLAAVSASINNRNRLKNLPRHATKNHAGRILVEQRWHGKLLAEFNRRAEKGAADRIAAENSKMKSATLLPSGAGWGGPRK